MTVLALLREPWPWYIAGPLIGLTVPLLLLLGNKDFGVSANLRHICSAFGSKTQFFTYDWRKEGSWNLLFFLGIVLGGVVAGIWLANPEGLKVAETTRESLATLGIGVNGQLAPDIFTWAGLLSLKGIFLMVGGGVLIGFGTAYAGGCTSGHSILGLANFQLPSLLATLGFFIGGLLTTHVLFPLIFRL